MELIDTHIHLWSPGTHPWVTDKSHPANRFATVSSYLVEDYKNDTKDTNVVTCVHVEAAWPGDPVGETIWVSEMADKAGLPNAIVAHCDLSSPNVEDILQRHCENKRVRGIRQTLNYSETHPEYCAALHDNYLTDPNWINGFSLLEKYDLSFELQVLPQQMLKAVSVVRAHPGVKVMLGHCGFPIQIDDPLTMRL